MKSRAVQIILALCTGVSLLLVTSFSGGVASAQAKRGGVLRIADSPPDGIDPLLTTSFSSLAVYEHMYNGLITQDYEMNLQPDLAERWQISGDVKTYTFYLRKGVKFHNGRELVADDVVYSLGRLLDPKTQAPLAGYYSSIDKVEAVDQYTVKITLKEPDASLLYKLSNRRPAVIMAKEVVGASGGNLKTADAGTGPFKLAELVPDVSVKLQRFNDYFEKDRPYLDGVTITFNTNEPTRLAALRAGQVDLTFFKDPNQVAAIRNNPNLVILEQPSQVRVVLILNNNKAPFDNPKFRQAISYAINRKEVIDALYGGKGYLTGVIPPGEKMWAIPATPENYPAYAPSIEKAKQLIAESGIKTPITVKVNTPTMFPESVPVAQLLKEQLKPIGVDLDINVMEWAAYLAAERKSEFQAQIGGFSGRADPDVYIYGEFHSKAQGNVSRLNSPRVDQLAEEGRRTSDLAKRRQIYAEAQRAVVNEAAFLFLAVGTDYDVVSKKVNGFHLMPTRWRLSVKDVWLSD
jgi:peptide/nickel transport system substrate-binding protein